MIPNVKDRSVTSSGVASSAGFGISMVDEAHIMGILRDTLYSDKVLAILREYGSNAWDAHRQAGKADVPIKVTIPTKMAPTLIIQDFGLGLSHEDVFTVYTQYGASTKRNDNNSVGMLGIGSKSGFAYSDSFTIVSANNGTRRTYIAVLDESEKGVINLLHEEPCDADDTGVQIHIPCKQEDIREFIDKATSLYSHFRPRPDINIELTPLPPEETVLANGVITKNRDCDWVGIMGCVPYRINLDQVRGSHLPDGGIGEYIRFLSGSLNFDIGEVRVSASREELKYDAATKAAIIRKFNSLVEEYVTYTLAILEKEETTPWDRRIRAQVLVSMHLPIPKALKDSLKDTVKLEEDFVSFTFLRNHAQTKTIHVDSTTRLIIKDEDKKLEGYGLKEYDYIVKPNDDVPLLDVETELEKLIAANGLTGIVTQKLSTLPWFIAPKAPKLQANGAPKVVNKKHQVSTFRLRNVDRFDTPWSSAWEIENRVPTDQDVFVVLRGFRVEGVHSFYHDYLADKILLETLTDEKMPTVYGYKSTDKKPITSALCQGTNYHKWREGLLDRVLTSRVEKLLRYFDWSMQGVNYYYANYSYGDGQVIGKPLYERLLKDLGSSHPIPDFLRKRRAARRLMHRIPKPIQESLRTLRQKLGNAALVKYQECQNEQTTLLEPYPLLRNGSFSNLWGDQATDWIHYVKLVDRARIAEEMLFNSLRTQGDTHEPPVVHADQRVNHGNLEGKADNSPEERGELPQAPESNHRGELDGSGEVPHACLNRAVVGQGQNQNGRGNGILRWKATPFRLERSNRGDGGRGQGSNDPVQLLGASSEKPVVAIGPAALEISRADWDSAHRRRLLPGLQIRTLRLQGSPFRNTNKQAGNDSGDAKE